MRTDDGLVRGMTADTVDEFLGIPYAAPPTGNLRWRPPAPPAAWQGVRDATQFGPSCPQPTANNPYLPPGPISEDCLYLNVYTPTLSDRSGGGRPVLVWIHGGGLVQDGARNYDGTKLAADGTVVVTINYRLGALGFLAHPALASRPGGPAGNYGLMDQQAALRWVQRNIAQFGGDPDNVTIAGQSAGGLSVLAQMVSPGARGLFQRAIVQSGTFALNQQPLGTAEAAGETFATAVGCPDQTAACLRSVPVSDLVSNFGVEIPGVVDGLVLTQPIGTALARGQFARVPVINGITHDEELLFVAGLGLTVSQGTDIPLAAPLSSSANYQTDIAQALGVSPARATVIAAEYPLSAYPNPVVAFSLLVSDASFACPALQVDRWTAARGVPTYAYQFNDDNAPVNIVGKSLGLATHGTELPYLFDQPNAPFPAMLNADQQALAASMRTDWASFAGTGDPSSRALPWPSFDGTRVLSLVPLQSQVTTETLGAINARYPDVPLAAALRTFTYTGERGEQATDTFVDAALFHDAVCAEAPAEVADTLARTQRPASLAAFATAVTGTPAWQRLPSWAVVATADHAIHPHAERDMAKRAGSEITEIDASHAVPATHPADVAAVIVRAVQAVG